MPPMKLSQLLARRQALLRQAQLASLAQAYQVVHDLAARITRAGLRGPVSLQPADPRAERFAATLTALAGNQSVLEEHFTDDDLLRLADAAVLAIDAEYSEMEFALEDMGELLAAPLRAALERAGVEIDGAGTDRSQVGSGRAE